MRAWVGVPALVSAALALGACRGSSSAPRPPGEQVRADVARDRAPEVTDAERQALVAGNMGFALDAYQVLRREAGNVVYSPLSVSMAMAMVHAGARGETRDEMTVALRYRLDEPALHRAFAWLELSLAERGDTAREADLERPRLELTNAVFLQRGFAVQPAYLQTLARHYGAGVSLMDFVQAPEPSRRQINAWVAERTANRIRELLPPSSITPLTRLVLANAVYFRGAWDTPFAEAATNMQGVFRTPGGDVIVPMMEGVPRSPLYAEAAGYQAVALPYQGNEMDMILVLPAAGGMQALDAFEAGLTLQSMTDLLAALAPRRVGVIMPRFSFGFDADMKQTLRALGMQRAFQAGVADLSGISATAELEISDVAHQAFIAVDEQGTEAAAATGVVVIERSRPPYVVLDRPFLFLIRDRVTGSILFLGRVVDPSRGAS